MRTHGIRSKVNQDLNYKQGEDSQKDVYYSQKRSSSLDPTPRETLQHNFPKYLNHNFRQEIPVGGGISGNEYEHIVYNIQGNVKTIEGKYLGIYIFIYIYI